MSGYYAVDLDGTLARYDRWRGEDHIGEPVPAMLERVRAWVALGREVKIFTARASTGEPRAIAAIQDWLERHGLPRLEVTCRKDYGMIVLFDDRCVQVETNTGRLVGVDEDQFRR